MNNELKIQAPKGEIWIKMRNKHGLTKTVFYENLIVNEFGRFLALCCLNPSALNSGLMWIEMGTGSSWNNSAPPAPSLSATGLENPEIRKKRSSFIYLDPSNPVKGQSLTPLGTSSRIFEMTWTLTNSEGNNIPFMELGIFANSNLGVSGTGSSYNGLYFDSASIPSIGFINADINMKGILINKKHFPQFQKSADWELDIVYRITFGE